MIQLPLFRSPTLSDLLRAGAALVVRCRCCGHAADVDVPRLAQDHGYTARVKGLHFRCACCGAEKVSVDPAG